jgi:hypothetical protein
MHTAVIYITQYRDGNQKWGAADDRDRNDRSTHRQPIDHTPAKIVRQGTVNSFASAKQLPLSLRSEERTLKVLAKAVK